jgi:hypothetical protein
MKRFILALLSCPTILGSAFCYLSALPALAADRLGQPDAQVCVWSPHKKGNLVCSRVDKIMTVKAAAPIDLASNPQTSPLNFEFSDAESDAAIALFGCDCPLCINSMRNLRTIAANAS